MKFPAAVLAFLAARPLAFAAVLDGIARLTFGEIDPGLLLRVVVALLKVGDIEAELEVVNDCPFIELLDAV